MKRDEAFQHFWDRDIGPGLDNMTKMIAKRSWDEAWKLRRQEFVERLKEELAK